MLKNLEDKYGSYECNVKPYENYTLVEFAPENMEFNNSYEVILVYVENDEVINVETVTPRIIPAERPKTVEINGIKIVEVDERAEIEVNNQWIIDLALLDKRPIQDYRL